MSTLLRSLVRGAVYSTLRALPLRLVLVLGAIALAVLIVSNGARAAVYEAPCPVDTSTPPLQTDPVCERLTQLVAQLEAVQENTSAAKLRLEDLQSLVEAHIDPDGDGNVVVYEPGGSGGVSEVSGTVQLADESLWHIDLVGSALWFALGCGFAYYLNRAIVRPLFNRGDLT